MSTLVTTTEEEKKIYLPVEIFSLILNKVKHVGLNITGVCKSWLNDESCSWEWLKEQKFNESCSWEWLKEQKFNESCSWDEDTFKRDVEMGNLEIN